MQQDFINKLQKMRDIYGHSMHISSGYRCPAHNAKIGGAKVSLHLSGQAADIALPSASNYAARFKLVKAALEAGFTCIELSDLHIHVDNRSTTPVLLLKHLTKTDMF
jgi:uncharacterized protein YcbK (DUF882 family)